MCTCALAAAQAKSLDAVKMAKAMQGFKLPPEVALMPDGAFFRAGQDQLIPDLYVGHAQSKGADDPEDLFMVDRGRQGRRRRRHAGRDRLQADVARLKLGKAGRRLIAAPGIPAGREGIHFIDTRGCVTAFAPVTDGGAIGGPL